MTMSIYANKYGKHNFTTNQMFIPSKLYYFNINHNQWLKDSKFYKCKKDSHSIVNTLIQSCKYWDYIRLLKTLSIQLTLLFGTFCIV